MRSHLHGNIPRLLHSYLIKQPHINFAKGKKLNFPKHVSKPEYESYAKIFAFYALTS